MPDNNSLASLIDQITASGDGHSLDDTLLHKIKAMIKKDTAQVENAYRLLIQRLATKHASVRLLAFLMMKELFVRSVRFRELFCQDLTQIVELTVAPRGTLPQPRAAASALRERALDCIAEWSESYGEALPQLKLAYRYLEGVLRMRFPRLREAEAARAEQVQQSRLASYREAYASSGQLLEGATAAVAALEAAVEAVVPRFNPNELPGPSCSENPPAAVLPPPTLSLEVELEAPEIAPDTKEQIRAQTEQLQVWILKVSAACPGWARCVIPAAA